LKKGYRKQKAEAGKSGAHAGPKQSRGKGKGIKRSSLEVPGSPRRVVISPDEFNTSQGIKSGNARTGVGKPRAAGERETEKKGGTREWIEKGGPVRILTPKRRSILSRSRISRMAQSRGGTEEAEPSFQNCSYWGRDKEVVKLQAG